MSLGDLVTLIPPGAISPDGQDELFSTHASQTVFYRQAYIDFIRLKAMTLQSMLQKSVTRETLRGQTLNLDAYKPVTLVERAARNADNNTDVIQRERRELVPRFFEYTELMDFRDALQMIRALQPDSQYRRAVNGAFERLKDCLIIDAFLRTEKGSDETTATATFDPLASHLIPVTVVTHEVLSVERVIEAMTIMMEDKVSQAQPWYVTVAPRAIADLLNNRQNALTTGGNVIDFDFNALRPLMSGKVTEFLGMTWQTTPELIANPDIDGGANGPGFETHVHSQDAIVLGMDSNVEVHFDVIADKGHSLQAAHYFTANTLRMHDENVVTIESGLAALSGP